MMDNELHFVTYDPDAIWDRMEDTYIENGGDFLFPGDEKEILLRSVLAIMVQAFAGVDNGIRMATLTYAQGAYLDEIGAERNCTRIEAAKARIDVLFMGNATIPKGTVITPDGAIYFATTEDGETGETITAECTEVGSAGNAIKAGERFDMPSAISGVEGIIAQTDAEGGMEREEDDAYRERIRVHGLKTVTAGPSRAYEDIARSVSTDIIDAKAINNGAGNVKVVLILKDGATAAPILANVLNQLSPMDKRPLSDHVTCVEAVNKVYNLKINYSIDSGASSLDALMQAAEEYRRWQDNAVGRAFNPDRLIAGLYQAGATRVQIDPTSRFNGGTVQYTEITDGERCKGNVTLEGI